MGKEEYVVDNEYFVKLGNKLKSKSEEFRNTVNINVTHGSSEFREKEADEK